MCKKICVLGNGFDLTHNLPTSYNHFKCYLENKYGCGRIEHVPSLSVDNHGDIVYDEYGTARFIYSLIDITSNCEKWSDFEEALGKIDYRDIFSDLTDYEDIFDRDGDHNLWHEAFSREDIASEMAFACGLLKEFFYEWISSVNLDAATKIRSFDDVFCNNQDMSFLTFNYTKTLEDVYGIEEVLHIHGSLDDDIIVGHGLTQEQIEEKHHINSLYLTGAEDILNNIVKSFKKDVAECLKENIDFFDDLGMLSDVYVCGLSYNEIDRPYIQTIIAHTDTQTTWHEFNHGNTDQKINTVKDYGFKGNFVLW